MTARDPLVGTLTERAEELTVRHRAIAEAPVGITIADMTQPDEPLIYVNDAFERITGYSRAETLDRNCRFLQGEETDEASVQRMREALEADETVSVVLRNYRKDGTPFWNELTLAPIHDDDEVPYYVGFQQDVTERREYHDRVRDQRDAFETLNAMVRHDIRNDLQLVLTSLELLEAHVDETGDEYLEAALESTQQAIDLTGRAREFTDAMQQAGTDHGAIPLAEVLDEQVADAREAHPDATVEMGSVPQVDVRADQMLGSVFRNLLTNAVVHNDAATPRVSVAVTVADDTAVVRVADNGPGVPADQQEAIFGRGETGGEHGGTGIGLYLVQTLAESYGGSVRVADDPELGGAAFVVRLPVER